MITFFYVDAFNLYFGSCRGTPYKWLDLAKLMEIVFPRNQVGTFAHRHWQRANSHPRCRTARARSRSQRPGDRSMTLGSDRGKDNWEATSWMNSLVN